MDLSGNKLLPASREVVWEMLQDIDALQASIPGCEDLARVRPETITALCEGLASASGKKIAVPVLGDKWGNPVL